MTTHPAVEDWREIVALREQRWKEALLANDPSADLILASLELARKRLAAAIKYSGQTEKDAQPDAPRPTAW